MNTAVSIPGSTPVNTAVRIPLSTVVDTAVSTPVSTSVSTPVNTPGHYYKHFHRLVLRSACIPAPVPHWL